MTEQECFLDGWLVDLAGGEITRDRQAVHLEPLVMRALAYLVSHHDEVVSKDRLIEAVWGHSHVSDAALTRCIFEIRKAFGDDAKESTIVETIPKVGYRLVATLQPPHKEKEFGSPALAWSAAAIIVVGLLVMLGVRTNTDDARYGDETKLPTNNSLAYDAYRKGTAQFEKNTYLNNENAIVLFEKALQSDPKFGLAYAGLSESLTRQIRFWQGDRMSDARVAAEKAIEFAPLRPESHSVQGIVLALSGNKREALVSFKRAYTLAPDHWQSAYHAATLNKALLEFRKAEVLFLQTLEFNPEHLVAMAHLGFLYLRMGEIDSSRRWLNRGIDKAPLEPYAWSQMATLEFVTGNTDKAIENCQKVRDFYPDHQACLHVLGVSNLMDEKMVEAREWFDYGIAKLPESSYARLGNAQILLADGSRDQGMAIISQVMEKMYRDVPNSDNPWEEYLIIAACYALYGDKSNAFVWLDKAAEAGRRFYLWDSIDPVFTTLHGDQRFDRYIAVTRDVSR